MKKFLFLFSFFLLAVSNLYAGEKTITISRNDVAWESANTVYNVTKGGVELVMSGGMNNPNFLLMKQHTTITVKSHNFNIKRIVFHCLDNYTNDNLDPFYWGPRTLHIQYSQTHAEYAGKLTYDYLGNTYDACWNSTFTGSYSTNGTAHKKYPDGIPAGYELMFENEGKPVRFASIDIVVEQEVGDMYELVTSQSEVKADSTYILVGRQYSTSTTGRALSVNETSDTPSGNPTRTSTPVELLENGYRVKATGEVQFIKLEATGNSTRPYYLKMGSNYLRRRSGDIDGSGNNKGWNLYSVSSLSNYESDLANYFRTSITINGSATYYNALIRFGHTSTETSGGQTYAIRHSNANKYFRDLDYSSNNNDAQYQRVYLYKPAKQYTVTTEVKPNAADGAISLRDGILVEVVNNETVNYSQKMDTVQFLVTAAEGKKIASIDIQALDDNNQVVDHIAPLTTSQTINGTLYTFVMPGHDVNIVATFADVEYHNINMLVKPSAVCGNIFITEGYVVQNDQVKSYDGQNVVFNVTPNPINPANESEGYYELINVTLTDNVTGVETVLVPDANGNYTFTMPDNEVTITANFRAKLMISTACEPNNGGYFEQSTMTCNGQGTNFYNGAQYYFGDVMTFMVKTNYGYKINKVIVTDGYGSETTLTPTSSYNDGNFYSFSMPNSNVTITAYFYKSVPDLYLLGTHNGNTAWHSYGPKFDYNADTQTYSIEVYYKGVNTNYSQGTSNDGDKYGYFSFTKSVKGDKNGDDWSIGPRYGSSTKDNDDVLGSYDNPTSNVATAGLSGGENCFKVPAGVYRIEVNKDITQTTITRLDVDLTFSPAGGNDEASAPITSYGTKVTMNSPIQTMVHNIADDYATDYPQYIANGFEEVDMSMEYSIAETTDLNTVKQSGTPTVNNPTFTLLDYNIADGEPVVKVDGDAWLGWIVADNTAYYKVIYTPLSWIEKNGVPGNTYTVSDELIIVHILSREASGDYPEQRLIWAKDQGNRSNNPTSIKDGQIDYMRNVLEVQHDDWDQSNWVMLKFPDGTDLTDTYERDMCIKAGTLKGRYVDNVNYCIEVEVAPQIDGTKAYTPNVFSTPNYIDANLNLTDESTGAVSPVNQKSYFFMNPKVQEVADVVAAVWNGTYFVIPARGNGNNAADLSGAFNVAWDYNHEYNVSSNLIEGHVYSFPCVLNIKSASGSKAGPDAASIAGKDVTPDANKVVMPFELQDKTTTAISDVMGSKAVSSVKYYNIMGVESNKPFDGVNIVVTRYSDGTISTTKVLR